MQLNKVKDNFTFNDIIKVYLLFYTPMCLVFILLFTHVIPDNNITQLILKITVFYALSNTFGYLHIGGKKNDKQN